MNGAKRQNGLHNENWTGLGKHVAKRKSEVVQVTMIVELALLVIKRDPSRVSVQNPAHAPGPLYLYACAHDLVHWTSQPNDHYNTNS